MKFNAANLCMVYSGLYFWYQAIRLTHAHMYDNGNFEAALYACSTAAFWSLNTFLIMRFSELRKQLRDSIDVSTSLLSLLDDLNRAKPIAQHVIDQQKEDDRK